MPAIKGDMYINTHCNYSQPTLIKLDNENIGGHLTPLQLQQSDVIRELLFLLSYNVSYCIQLEVHVLLSFLIT